MEDCQIRITLGPIEDLVGDRTVVHLGRATFRRKFCGSNILVATLPKEKRHIEMPPRPGHFYNPLNGTNDRIIEREINMQVISYAEEFLREEGLYLAEAHYKPYRIRFDIPFLEKLEGELYGKS